MVRAAVGTGADEEDSGCDVTGCGAMASILATASSRSSAAAGIVSCSVALRNVCVWQRGNSEQTKKTSSALRCGVNGEREQ